jgi:hypothetical protein
MPLSDDDIITFARRRIKRIEYNNEFKKNEGIFIAKTHKVLADVCQGGRKGFQFTSRVKETSANT